MRKENKETIHNTSHANDGGLVGLMAHLGKNTTSQSVEPRLDPRPPIRDNLMVEQSAEFACEMGMLDRGDRRCLEFRSS